MGVKELGSEGVHGDWGEPLRILANRGDKNGPPTDRKADRGVLCIRYKRFSIGSPVAVATRNVLVGGSGL
jgi:hypothetical protein